MKGLKIRRPEEPQQQHDVRHRQICSSAGSAREAAKSVATFIDLWYVTQTTKAISDEELQRLRSLLSAPDAGVEICPITLEVAEIYQSIPRSTMRDPWDRLIVATAMYYAVPLVTRDANITKSQLVQTIW